MDNFWKIFFKTLDPVLSILAIIFVALILSLDLWLFDIPASSSFFEAGGKFVYGIGLSYVAAYIFYLITVHYPETKKSYIIHKTSAFPANAIVTNIESIFVDMAKKLGENVAPEKLDDSKIKDILSKTHCFGDSTLSHSPIIKDKEINISHMNWIEYLFSREKTIKSFINDIKPLYSHLDAEFISAISAIEQSQLSGPIIGMVELSAKVQKDKNNLFFADGLEDFFLTYYHKALNLKEINQNIESIYSLNIKE